MGCSRICSGRRSRIWKLIGTGMGRPAKPLTAHRAQNTLRMDRHANRLGELTLVGNIGQPPKWMPKEGKKLWKHLTGIGGYGSILSPQHRAGFEDYCWLEARLKAEQGMVHEGENLKFLSASEKQMLHSMRMQVAGYPGSNSKVTLPVKPVENKWQDLPKPIPIAT